MPHTEPSIKAVTDKTFADEVLPSEKPVLVDFWAAWCSQCKRIAPVLEEIAADYGDRITVVTVDADSNPECMQEHAVLSLPTMMLFHRGREVKRIVGTRSKSALLSEIEVVL